MGTQQILLIVLSVIIVGAAIAVGIQMFNNQSFTANRSAIAADAQSYASQIVQYYKTPISQGGAGGATAAGGEKKIADFIGFTEGEAGGAWGAGEYGIDNDNGFYVIHSVTDTTAVIKGTGKEEQGGQNPVITTTITFPAGTISAEAGLEDVEES